MIETTSTDFRLAVGAFRNFLLLMGLDLRDENLKGTPERVAKYYQEFLTYKDTNLKTSFESMEVDQMILVKDMPFASLCAHHLLPFTGKVAVAYICSDRITGLSKLGRVVDLHSHKPQVQERLTADIARHVGELVPNNLGVAVVVYDAVHTCMSTRGVKKHAKMVTTVLTGGFKENPQTRSELYQLLTLA